MLKFGENAGNTVIVNPDRGQSLELSPSEGRDVCRHLLLANNVELIKLKDTRVLAAPEFDFINGRPVKDALEAPTHVQDAHGAPTSLDETPVLEEREVAYTTVVTKYGTETTQSLQAKHIQLLVQKNWTDQFERKHEETHTFNMTLAETESLLKKILSAQSITINPTATKPQV